MPNLINLNVTPHEYPVTFDEFRRRFKDTSFADPIRYSDFGYEIVFDVPQPVHTKYQYCRELLPNISSNGMWGQVWEVRNLSDEMTPEDYTARIAQVAQDKAEARMVAVVSAVQSFLDRTAQERQYDNIFTLISYILSPDPVFKAEAEAGNVWRDAVWVQCREIKDAVIAGTRPLPTVKEVLAELPAMVWPGGL